ncbi:sigma-54 dependent transcriptional regulator [Thauera sinica]|uniref:sigma-54 dependent transcriptional regulator n=1 Tax=Thauera sinica TaxID=2665146 RepID=UPI0036D99D7D
MDRGGALCAELHALELQDWDFQVVPSLDAARRTLAAGSASVGLVVFDSVSSWLEREIEALIAHHDIEWIALLGQGLLRSGAVPASTLRLFHDFHSMPLDRERLQFSLGHAYGKVQFCSRESEPPQVGGRYGMTGTSPKMLQLYRQLDKVVAVDAPVLIGGESGSGKELVAHAIHQHSARAHGPFIAMNCGAIAPSLIHSELFGYERGAFTGATQRKVGNIEAASGGVLFLDEIGDLPLDLQASLLRFLQEKMITRVGSTERVKVNVRVIAATHVDLARAVADGRFRQDLYYRLNVLHLHVPPLRERREDIPRLAEAVFADNRHQKSSQVKGFSSEAVRTMVDYPWPGNVRELVNRVQQAMIMSEHKFITAADLGLPSAEGEVVAPTLEELRASVEREVIETSLRKYRNNVSETARQLGISRVTLYRMIDRLKIIL